MGLASITNNIITDTSIPSTSVITGTLGTGQVGYGSAANTIAGSNNLFWDNTNGRLGIGTNAPLTPLAIKTNSTLTKYVEIGYASSLDLNYIESLDRVSGNVPLAISASQAGAYLSFRIGAAAENARFTSLGNLHLGTYTTDSGQRLQVTGDTLLKGSGNTSGTTALTVQNSGSTNILTVRNDGLVGINNASPNRALDVAGAARITGALSMATNNGTEIVAGSGSNRGLVIQDNSGGTSSVVTLTVGNSTVQNVGKTDLALTNNYNTISAYTKFLLTGNFTESDGGGITRAIYINTTIGTTNNYRAIEWSNNNGWGLYGAGTAANYLGGSLGIGINTLTGYNLRVFKNITGGGYPYNVSVAGAVQSDVTNVATYIQAISSTQAATFTLPEIRLFVADQGSFGAGSTVTGQTGFYVSNLTGATTNIGFYGGIAAATNRWNLYMGGTAANYLGGTLTVNNQITAGNAQATAGSVVLRTTYSSGNISNIGTNGSSGGMSINYAVYPASTSLADAYLSGVGTLSFPRSSYIVQADHRWLSAAAALVAEGSAVTLTEKMRLYNSGNLVIQDGGTYSDAGQRLQVYGDTLMKGSGNTNATTALKVQNSDGANLFYLLNNGEIRIGDSGGAALYSPRIYSSNNDATPSTGGSTLVISPRRTSDASNGAIYIAGIVFNATSGLNQYVNLAQNFEPTSGTAVYNMLQLRPAINQTGGANGITRGLYVNPNLALGSGPADWRSIEWSNNSGWGLYGVGTAPSYFAGNVQIGSATAISNNINLQVTGRQYTLHNVTYNGTGVQTFATVKNVTINQTITGGNGINNQVNTGLNIFSSTQSVPETTTYANLFNYNEYRFDAAGVTLSVDQSTGGIRTISQLTTQNVFGGSINGTMSHVSGIQINGYYNNATGSITPTITNAYQLLINDTGEFGHTFNFTNRWGIYQKGINDRNYFAGNMLLNDTNDTGQILQVTGAIRVNGQRTTTSGAASGQFLSINCDGTTYKIALLNP